MQSIRMIAVAVLLLAGCPWLAHGAEPRPAVSALSAANVSNIQVPIYKSRVLSTRTAVKRISVGNPDIADILITSPTQLYLLGRSLGSTNVLLWDGNNKLIDSLDLEVVHDLSGLKGKLYQLLPNETIEVFSAQGSLVLRGQVSSAAVMDTAVKVAKTYAAQTSSIVQGEGEEAKAKAADSLEVINLLSIGGGQQVMLEVKVAEMQRNLVKRLGVRFLALGTNGNWSFGGFNNGSSVVSDGLVSDGAGLLAQFASGSFVFNMVLEAAKEDGSAKVLAEPTLVTLTGQEAEFISGGEFPIPVSDDDGISIEYKEFGVGVKFLPVVLDSDRINLNLNVLVSELVAANSLVVNTGATTDDASLLVPALTKRSAQSTVELGDGQTIAIAGLISEKTRDNVSRFPGLGDIAVIGNLFRSQEFIKGETELVILVTPHIAKPVDAKLVRLPTERFVEPSDMDFYLLGKTKSSQPGRTVPVSLGVTGSSFGHDLR